MLNLADGSYKEVSDEDRKELADFVSESLDGPEETLEYERMVQTLTNSGSQVRKHMDEGTTSWPMNPNQGSRWRGEENRARLEKVWVSRTMKRLPL